MLETRKVSINSTSYKRSDRLRYYYKRLICLESFPLIPLLIKEAILRWLQPRQRTRRPFPLIPLLIKEAIKEHKKAVLSHHRVSINSTSYKRSDHLDWWLPIPYHCWYSRNVSINSTSYKRSDRRMTTCYQEVQNRFH